MLRRVLDEYEELKAAQQLSQIDIAAKEVESFLLAPGDGIFAKKETTCRKNLHRMNLIGVAVSESDNLVATGGADREVVVSTISDGSILRRVNLPAAVLSIDFHPSLRSENAPLAAATTMGGHCFLLDLEAGTILQTLKDHSKFVTRVGFSPDGRFLVTCSHDHTANVYRVRPGTEGKVEAVHSRTLRYRGTVEALEFLSGEPVAVLGVREDNYLHYINLDTLEDERVNVNENLDDHVSFTPMDIRKSPDGRALLVATDKDKLIIFPLRSSKHLCTLYGAPNGGFATPRCAWARSGKYVYGTGEDNCIYVWDVAVQQVVHRLTGHTGIVRNIIGLQGSEGLVSVSFDKTLRLWHAEEDNGPLE